jgi:hypothetical protein
MVMAGAASSVEFLRDKTYAFGRRQIKKALMTVSWNTRCENERWDTEAVKCSR